MPKFYHFPLDFERKKRYYRTMMTPEIDLQKHLNRRLRVLHRHERQRVLGDAAKDNNLKKVSEVYPDASVDSLPQIARQTYEQVIHGADVWSCERNRRRTAKVIKAWAEQGKITPEQAGWFLEKADLGYAGETRIEVVASGARADQKVALNPEDSQAWLTHALEANRKHQNWRGTIDRVFLTLDQNPIFWPAMIGVDKGVIYFRLGDLAKALECFQHAKIQTENVLKDPQATKSEKFAAASDGGVAYIRIAQILESLKNKGKRVKPRLIFEFYRRGRNLVHWAGHQTRNYERSRIIELWYTQFCLKNRLFNQLPSIAACWLWLLRNHQDTQTMFKSCGLQFLHKIRGKFSLYQYFEAAGHD